ncbi:uncharacterized protein LOC128895614 isoform X1 [Hylaeus anthracinus]|uniref:uncharacterized protein LOC128895614 isoform X1 n=1 Tax=Hylaeus anthracinus TaxID=313031 RepID=UPI0023B8D8C1|nr:uncharacterized protein LOC128895614 isoform X1 [Hylaeus anthracinus]
MFEMKYAKKEHTQELQKKNVLFNKERDTMSNERNKRDTSISFTKLDMQEEYKILCDNIVILNSYTLICEICNCPLPSQNHVLAHVQGKQHVNTLKQQTKKEDSNQNMTHHMCNNFKTEKCQSNLNINNKCNDNMKQTDQMLVDNGIIILESNTISCRFCKRKFPSFHDTLAHIKGRSHINILKSLNKMSSTVESKHVKHEIIKTSITDKKSLTNFSKIKINIDTSQKQDLGTNIYKTTCCTKLSTKNVNEGEHLINDIDGSKYEKIQDESEKDVGLLQNCFYYCELCNVQIDINNLFEHINTITHTRSIFSMSMGDDIILYKCFCCKSIMQGNSSLINHLRLETHLKNLASTLEGIDMSNNKILAHAPRNIKNVLENKNFWFCNILFPKVENTSADFIEKYLISIDTSDINLQNNIKNNVTYRCSFCRAKLNTHHNLIDHCRGKIHTWRVKQLFHDKKYCGTNNNTLLVTDQFSDMSIADKKSQSTNKLDSGLILPPDLCIQIEKCLKESPFNGNLARKRDHKENIKKCKEKSLAERLNKLYCKHYLEIEEKMYTLDKKEHDKIEANFKLLMPHNKNNFYCLACSVSVSKELYSLYEHVRYESHVLQVDQIKKDIDSEKLSLQYTKKTKTYIKCYPCKNTIKDGLQMINTHINSTLHRKNYTKFRTIIDDTFKSVLQNLNCSLFYSIEMFSCTLCATNFKYKLEFMEHIFTKHKQMSENYTFDFCIPCATLWMGQTDSYIGHCNDIMHKYLTKSKDFMIEDLPTCIKKILTKIDKTVNILFEQSEILSNDNIQEEVRQSLENSLRIKFPSVKAFLFGSRLTGLGLENSDIDIYIDCGNTYYESKSDDLRNCNLTHIEQSLRAQKEQWDVKDLLEGTRTPIIKLIYKRTGVDCDISITNGLSVENSKLIRSFNDAYLPCRKLILFIKKWFSLFNLPGRCGLTNYALSWIVIFYLQSKSYLPSIAKLIKEKNQSQLIHGWETGIAQPMDNNESVQSIPVLLLDLFKFYANFDYQHYIICPLLGNVLAKKAFSELETLPKEMEPYKRHLKTSKKPEYLRIDSPLCVQDPFDLSHNLTKAVNSITLKYFKQYCEDSASILCSTKH